MTASTTSKGNPFNHEDSNTSRNPELEHIMAARLSRRQALLGSAGAVVGSALAGVGSSVLAATPAGAATQAASPAATPSMLGRLDFAAVGKSLADTVVVPAGYNVQVLYALGDPLHSGVPTLRNDGTDGDWERRAGDHHDGMEWFGLDANGRPSRQSNTRALLAINHEATTDEKLSSFFIHAQGGASTLPRPATEVDKELAIHGLSVVEIEAQGGRWSYHTASRFNRRVTAMTEVEISGPARGSAHLITRYSPDGKRARGTLNNCGTGKTPWGTFVSGEENWYGYFARDAADDARRSAEPAQVTGLVRYGRKAGAPSRHGWESAGPRDAYARWNNSVLGNDARSDYRNEMNTFGYVVEMDAYEPQQLVRKRTGLGRFAHESVSFAKPVAGQPIVAYMGDDARNEYMYKFVSRARWNPADANPRNRMAAGDKYLDQGTLYAARFNEDGSGEWLELSLKNPAIANYAGFPFKTEADIAVFTRLAADAVGATKMDRPEWGGVNPRNGEFYMTLTNNSNRTVDGPVGVNAANPRSYSDMKGNRESRGNVNGHIIRIAHGQPADVRFRWDIYLFGAQADADTQRVNLSSLTDDNDFSSPDGLVFSEATGLCWIQTDDGAYTDKSNCMLLAAVPGKQGDGDSKTLTYARADGSSKQVSTPVGRAASPAVLKRFLVGPVDCEITGLCESPDGRAMFINIQHPGEGTKMADVGDPSKYTSHWPANAGYGAGSRPRSATVVITREDGGVIGS